MFKKENNKIIYSIALIIVLGTLIYFNSFNSSFHFDDDASITENPAIKHISDIKTIWRFVPARSLAYLSFALNYYFGRLDVFGYHLVNLIIHLLNSMILYFLMLSSFATPVLKNSSLKKHQDIISLFASLIFLTHPIQTQAVTYIVQRVAALASLFYLATLSLYLKFRLSQRPLYYAFALFTAFLGIFTKEIFITLPLAILLYELCFFGKENLAQRIKPLLPFFLVIVLIILNIKSGGGFNLGEVRAVTRLTEEFSRKDYLFTQFNVLRTYVRLLILPINQNLDYDYPLSTSLDLPTSLSLLLILSILGLGVYLFRKKPHLSFGIFFFFLGISVESSIFPIPDVIFEHRLYLPCLGFAIFLAILPMELFKRRKPYLITLSAIIIALSLLTYKRNFVWRDELSLWQDVRKKSPQKARAYNNLGAIYYAERSNIDVARGYFQKAIELNPDYADAYSNLGTIFNALGQYQEAIQYYQKAIALNPKQVKVYYNLGATYSILAQYQEAIQYYQKAISLNPGFSDAHYKLGLIFHQLGQYDQAIPHYQMAIKFNPEYFAAYDNLGIIYGAWGEYNQARQYCQKAIELKPNYFVAYHNLGVTYDKLNQPQQAIQCFHKVIELKPDFAETHHYLAKLYLREKKYDLALTHCDRALALGFKVNPEILQLLQPYRRER